MSVLILTSDLTTGSQAQGAATRQHRQAAIALSAAALIDKARANPPSLVIVDLSLARLDIAAVAAELKALNPAPAIVAFGPHVHETKLNAARDAGCDLVLTRGQFASRIDEVFERYG